jgi:hypothetical protein
VIPDIGLSKCAVTETSDHIGDGGGREVHTIQNNKAERINKKDRRFAVAKGIIFLLYVNEYNQKQESTRFTSSLFISLKSHKKASQHYTNNTIL